MIMSKTTATNSKQTVKAIATVKQTASNSKKQFDLSAINEKIANKKQNSKQTADSKKQTASNSKKQNSKKQTADSKQNSDNNSVKLSAYKTACRMCASLANSASDNDKALVKQIREAIQHDDFIVVCKDTTACALFIVDNNKNTVCNVYDCLRIQFTTVQARKYKDALLADSRFYTHLYKNNEFISCKCDSFDSFVSAMNYVYTVYMNSKQTATATEQTAEQQIAK